MNVCINEMKKNREKGKKISNPNAPKNVCYKQP